MSFLIAVATGAMFAVAGVADVNAVEFAMHSVLVELAVDDAAGNAVVDLFCHSAFLLHSIRVLFPRFALFMPRSVDKLPEL